jgi:hypothetical protein
MFNNAALGGHLDEITAIEAGDVLSQGPPEKIATASGPPVFRR